MEILDAIVIQIGFKEDWVWGFQKVPHDDHWYSKLSLVKSVHFIKNACEEGQMNSYILLNTKNSILLQFGFQSRDMLSGFVYRQMLLPCFWPLSASPCQAFQFLSWSEEDNSVKLVAIQGAGTLIRLKDNFKISERETYG